MTATDSAIPDRPANASVDPASPGFADRERDVLFQEFQPLVRRLIRQYGDTAEMRQDLEGESYLRFCRLLDEYDVDRGIPLRPYLVRKLIASVYTYARSGWRRARFETCFLPEHEEPAERTGPDDDWDERLIRDELAVRLPAAIEMLPVRQRQALMWRYYEERSYEEIAERMGVMEASARSLVRHAINGLRRRFL